LRDLSLVGLEPGCKVVWVWGNEFQNQAFFKKIMSTFSFFINRRKLFNVFRYTDDEVQKWIEHTFNKFKPDYIYGYAGSIYEIAKVIKQRNLKIVPIKKIITTSERLENRKFIEEVFNCKVIDQYGCSEVYTIAIEDDNYLMHSSDDFVFVELDQDNQVLVTPLESYGMPLIRYKLGDIGIKVSKNQSESKSPFKEFKVGIGRVYEVLLNNKNEKISGGLIKQYIEDEHLELNEFQLVQDSYEKVNLNVVKDKFTSEQSVQRLVEIIKEILGCSFVEVNYLEKYPIEKNGKRIAFKCNIKP
jgi:phenylacetate-CoA ligase